jgi:hypothetical protein
MKIKEMIEKLEELRKEHEDDIEVFVRDADALFSSDIRIDFVFGDICIDDKNS